MPKSLKHWPRSGENEAVRFRVLIKGTGFPRYWVPFSSTLVKNEILGRAPSSQRKPYHDKYANSKEFQLNEFIIDISGLKLV